MDGLLFAFLWMSTSLFLMPYVLNATMHTNELTELGHNYQLASHLFVVMQERSDGGSDLIEVKDLTTKIDSQYASQIVEIDRLETIEPNYLLEHLQYYYLNFLTGENIELPTDTEEKHYDAIIDHFVSPNYDKEITVGEVTDLAKNIYTLDWFKTNILENKEEYVLNEESKIYELKDGSDKETANKYLKNKLYNATSHLYYSDFYQDINRTLIIADLLRFIPTYVISFALVYLLFPMIFKNGETLGKITLQIGMVNKLGYKVTKPQVLLRFLFFFLEITFSTFILGMMNWTMLATLGIGVAALMIATLISKDNRSLHDYIAGTMVIDVKKSVFFKDAKEEASVEEGIENDLKKYSSGQIIDAHVIQVGSTVIDEDLKKDLDKNK